MITLDTLANERRKLIEHREAYVSNLQRITGALEFIDYLADELNKGEILEGKFAVDTIGDSVTIHCEGDVPGGA